MQNEFSWGALLKSERFWAIVITAFSVYLASKGIFGVAETTLVSTILGGFVIVRTVDRAADKKVEAAEIAAAGDMQV